MDTKEISDLRKCLKNIHKQFTKKECEDLVKKYANIFRDLPNLIKIEIMTHLEIPDLISLCSSSDALEDFCIKNLDFKMMLCDKAKQKGIDLYGCDGRLEKMDIYHNVKRHPTLLFSEELNIIYNWLKNTSQTKYKRNDIKNIKELYLTNVVYIPKEIYILKKLKKLSITGRSLENTVIIPDELFLLKQLEYLKLSHIRTNDFQSNLKKLKNLKYFDISMRTRIGVIDEMNAYNLPRNIEVFVFYRPGVNDLLTHREQFEKLGFKKMRPIQPNEF